jgi:hypothetical protein
MKINISHDKGHVEEPSPASLCQNASQLESSWHNNKLSSQLVPPRAKSQQKRDLGVWWQAKNGRVLNRFECASGDEILNVFQEIEEEVENQVRGQGEPTVSGCCKGGGRLGSGGESLRRDLPDSQFCRVHFIISA